MRVAVAARFGDANRAPISPSTRTGMLSASGKTQRIVARWALNLSTSRMTLFENKTPPKLSELSL
jgi:hypothetical protein